MEGFVLLPLADQFMALLMAEMGNVDGGHRVRGDKMQQASALHFRKAAAGLQGRQRAMVARDIKKHFLAHGVLQAWPRLTGKGNKPKAWRHGTDEQSPRHGSC